MSTSPSQAYYDLADFVGMTLDCKSGLVDGKSQIKVDWGLVDVYVNQKVFDSFVDPDTGAVALLIGACGDLGVGVIFDPASREMDVFVLDRSNLGERGSGFFGSGSNLDLWASTTKEAFDMLKAVSVVRFRGPVKGPFLEIKKDGNLAA
jgi:hypothetical protein